MTASAIRRDRARLVGRGDGGARDPADDLGLQAHRACGQHEEESGGDPAQRRGGVGVGEDDDRDGCQQHELDADQQLRPPPAPDAAPEDDRDRDPDREAEDRDRRAPGVAAAPVTERDPEEHRVPALVGREHLEDPVEADGVHASGDERERDGQR